MDGTITLRDGCVRACRACQHRQWSQEESEQQKLAGLQHTLAQWVDQIAAVQGVSGEARWGYREKVKLSARCYDGRWEFGTEPYGDFLPLPRCPIQSARITAALALLRDHLPDFEDLPMRYFMQHGPLVTLVVKAARLRSTAWVTEQLCADLRAIGVTGLHVNLHPAAGRVLLSENGWRCLWGESLAQDAMGLWHGPGEEGWLSPTLHSQALDQAAGFLAADAQSSVVDLHCGHGASLRRWVSAGANAIGVEFDGAAVACAKRNAPAATILRGPCAQRLPQVRAQLAEHPERTRLAYVSPPRTGLDPAVVYWLAEESGVQRLAYLSANPGSLKQDLATLCTSGYAVAQLLPFDFFPQTHHIEALALLQRHA